VGNENWPMGRQHAAAARFGPEQGCAVEGIYSIGAVAFTLGVPVATLRTWEERYGVISPERTAGGHRLYTPAQVDQLRFVVAELASGMSAADAHRSLAQRMLAEPREGTPGGRPRASILIAERDQFAAERIEFLLRTAGVLVEVALHFDQAVERFELARPDLVIVELLIDGGAGEVLCRRLKERRPTPVLVISALNAADRALRAGADAFLLKPVGHLQLASTVEDLLDIGVMPRRLRAPRV
jgi:DNA-binding transcriptional MerR regulator